MEKDTGGNAFPTTAVYESEKGMTLRDYFAARAMQGFLANAWQSEDMERENYTAAEQIEATAEVSYAVADAMLKARNA